MHSFLRELVERERVGYTTAVDREVMAAGMISGAGAGVEFQAGEIENGMNLEADRITEYVTGQRPVLDLERCRSLEQDDAGTCRPDRIEVERTTQEESAPGIRVARMAEREGVRALFDK